MWKYFSILLYKKDIIIIIISIIINNKTVGPSLLLRVCAAVSAGGDWHLQKMFTVFHTLTPSQWTGEEFVYFFVMR